MRPTMSEIAHYQGFTIHSTPRHVPEWNKWAMEITISVDHAGDIKAHTFSGGVLYLSEAEADSQGMAFGRRVIDGKVPGQSVENLKAADRRAAPRFRVQFRTTFAGVTKVEGTGLILDLSLGGARVESRFAPEPSAGLELRIYVPGQDWPLMVDGATVQWVRGEVFGLAFNHMKDAERTRLGDVLATLNEGGR
jgi:hypothetical protein